MSLQPTLEEVLELAERLCLEHVRGFEEPAKK